MSSPKRNRTIWVPLDPRIGPEMVVAPFRALASVFNYYMRNSERFTGNASELQKMALRPYMALAAEMAKSDLTPWEQMLVVAWMGWDARVPFKDVILPNLSVAVDVDPFSMTMNMKFAGSWGRVSQFLEKQALSIPNSGITPSGAYQACQVLLKLNSSWSRSGFLPASQDKIVVTKEAMAVLQALFKEYDIQQA